ncbi:hypothetical protein [Aurantimonas endophytica]|uniref:Uncharacterized protein n=1 Tax=Aurantimonas endophytica TaxID=1522175 RepID=A0A7W6HDE0_9HYPH|nr:hypothetical protein [Aurantimonas endophytica]MBB4003175.1 hypothetical protein [Aurantimonas endophytica]MCO6404044.1 hypothetical protein [Aurantimonas endophytica]
MTNDSERPLRTLILDLTMKVMELQKQIQRMEEADAARYDLLFELCVPVEFRDEIDSLDGIPFDVVEAPVDVAGPLRDWMKKTR